jgi:uncharacterized protein YwqG
MSLNAIKEKLAGYRRSVYFPEVCIWDFGPDQSKFAGVPWINAGEPWPACGHCGRPMQLFLQLNLSGLPLTVPGWPERGFVQVFYCTNPETYCEQCGDDAFSPFGKFLCARVLDPADRCEFTDEHPLWNPLQARSIMRWLASDDYPSDTELDVLAPGLLSEAEADLLFEAVKDTQLKVLAEITTTNRTDKLGGWPAWIQGFRPPRCPQCDTRMEYVFQIRSEGNLDYQFGDCGIAHLYHCPNHPRLLGYSWTGC